MNNLGKSQYTNMLDLITFIVVTKPFKFISSKVTQNIFSSFIRWSFVHRKTLELRVKILCFSWVRLKQKGMLTKKRIWNDQEVDIKVCASESVYFQRTKAFIKVYRFAYAHFSTTFNTILIQNQGLKNWKHYSVSISTPIKSDWLQNKVSVKICLKIVTFWINSIAILYK